MGLMVHRVAFGLCPRNDLVEKFQGHCLGEVILAGMAVDEIRPELLGSLHLLLEHLNVGLDQGLWVLQAWGTGLSEAWEWASKDDAPGLEPGCHWAIGEDHDDDLELVLAEQGLELVLAMVQDGLEWNFYAIIA